MRPAVSAGHGTSRAQVTVNARACTEVRTDGARLIDGTVAGASDDCLVRDVQWDYLGRDIIHIDLTRVDLKEEVEVEVELQLTGEAVGLKEAGTLLDQQMNMIGVKCRADSIPEHLEHDISELNVGDTLTVADLTAPAGVAFTSDPEAIVASIQFAKVAEETEEAAADGTEPEVIGAKDDDGGDD